MASLFAVNKSIIKHELCVPDLTAQQEVVYPSEWFRKNPGKKPNISMIPDSAPRLYHEIKDMMKTGGWSDLIVTSFMSKVILENPLIFEYEAPFKWESMGLHIANIGDKINPLSLVSITSARKLPEEEQIVRSDSKERLSLFFAFLTVYRKAMARVNNEALGTVVAQRLNTFFKANKMNMTDEDGQSVSNYVSDNRITPDYRKLIASIDMFYFNLPSHPYAGMQIATLTSRFYGCMALASIGEIARISGLQPLDLAKFIFTVPVATDLDRIAKREPGLSEPTGYFPYQLDFGLTIRSAYSSAANPTLFFWLHTIGVILGLPRSVKATMPKNVHDIAATATSAVAVALHFSQGGRMERRSADTQEKAENYCQMNLKLRDLKDDADKSDSEIEEEDSDRPKIDPIEEDSIGKRANTVLSSLRSNNGLTQEEITIVHMKLTMAKTAPDNSIGQYLAGLYAPPK